MLIGLVFGAHAVLLEAFRRAFYGGSKRTGDARTLQELRTI